MEITMHAVGSRLYKKRSTIDMSTKHQPTKHLIFHVIFIALAALASMYLWNCMAPNLGVPTLSYVQVIGVVALAALVTHQVRTVDDTVTLVYNMARVVCGNKPESGQSSDLPVPVWSN
jgi:hypothetical protein